MGTSLATSHFSELTSDSSRSLTLCIRSLAGEQRVTTRPLVTTGADNTRPALSPSLNDHRVLRVLIFGIEFYNKKRMFNWPTLIQLSSFSWFPGLMLLWTSYGLV